jgi:hypothetical protein
MGILLAIIAKPQFLITFSPVKLFMSGRRIEAHHLTWDLTGSGPEIVCKMRPHWGYSFADEGGSS